MKIALILPPYTSKIFSENLSTVDEEFCLAPPIILAYVAAILEEHGHKVMLLDARALGLSKEEALKKIQAFGPDLLGFRAETYHFHDALEWVNFLKNGLKIPVFTGGINMDLYPKETLSHESIDYGIAGEAIHTLPKFLQALENGEDLSKIKGLGYKGRDSEIFFTPSDQPLVDFNLYPFPARHLLANEKYYSFISQRKNFTVMLTATGCPFKCSFCAIPSVYRFRSPQKILKEIDLCYKEFNIREIDFFDAVLFMPRDRILEIFQLLKNRKYDLEWSCRSRVDLVDEEILKAASAAGCRQVYYGIESFDQDVLNQINKNIAPEKVIRAIKLSKKYGIRVMGFFMVGNAGDTIEKVRRTIKFAKKLDLDFIQVCRTIAKPGTSLDRELIRASGYDFWREHVLGNKISDRLPTPWTTLSESQKAKLTKEFYLKFYFRPSIIFRRIIQLKSPAEIFRYVKVGLKLFLRKPRVNASFITDTTEAENYLKRSPYFLDEARILKVAVVIPTFCEKDTIEKIVAAIVNILPQAHIIIVDDQSPDGTAEVVKRLISKNPKIHLIERSGKRGLGYAYKDGFKFVLANLDSEYIFEMDADFSHNPHYLPLFLHYARFFDLVTGSRFLNKVSIKNRQLWRNIISKTTKWFVNLLIDMNLTDVTTGFKCFRRSILQSLDIDSLESSGFAFQIEGSYQVKSKGGKIKEIPILFVERTIGSSKMSGQIMKEGISLVIRLFLKHKTRNKKNFL